MVTGRALQRPALAAALSLALLPAAALGEESLGVLAVAEPPGPSARLVALTGELRSALAARGTGVLDAEALRLRMAGSASPSMLAELDRGYAGALAAHAAGEWEPSNRMLRAVIGALERLPDGPEVFAAWTRAMLRLARSEQELGRGVEAQALLERLVRAEPELRAEPRSYPPSFRRLMEEARARLWARGTRRLTVESQPEARVFVDGREVGTSPIALDLPPGRYRVVGLCGGLHTPAEFVDLAEDRTIRLDTSLVAALRPDAGPGLALAEPGRAIQVVTAADRLGLDRAVVAAAGQDGQETLLVATLLDVRRGVAEREGRISVAAGAPVQGAIDALASFLLTGRPSPLVTSVEAPSLALGPEGAERVLHAAPGKRATERSSALGWTATATGVVAIAAGTAAVILGRAAQGRYDEARGMLDGSGHVAPPNSVASYNTTLAAGDRRRDAAIGLGVAAGMSAAATAVLSYLSWRRTGEIGPFRF